MTESCIMGQVRQWCQLNDHRHVGLVVKCSSRKYHTSEVHSSIEEIHRTLGTRVPYVCLVLQIRVQISVIS